MATYDHPPEQASISLDQATSHIEETIHELRDALSAFDEMDDAGNVADLVAMVDRAAALMADIEKAASRFRARFDGCDPDTIGDAKYHEMKDEGRLS